MSNKSYWKECDHHFAMLEGHMVNIADVNEENRKSQFECPSCHSAMVPVLGSKRQHHFRHLGSKCKYEDYLHSMAEIIIRDWMNMTDDIPVIIESQEFCNDIKKCPIREQYYDPECSYVHKKQINLKDFTDSWETEQSYTKNGNLFRADILCNSKTVDDVIFIEIYVTHPCTQEKLNSGIKIIEVKIDSEEDIFNFISEPICECEKVKFYNFEPLNSNTAAKSFTDIEFAPCYKEWFRKHAREIIANYIKDESSVLLSFPGWEKCSNFASCSWSSDYECIQDHEYVIDLKKYIDTVETDCKLKDESPLLESFKADIRLSSSRNKKNEIIIMINVGKKIDADTKMHLRALRKKIIEFNISNEDDIEYVLKDYISEEKWTRYYNFNLKFVTGNEHFKKDIKRFILFPSGKGKSGILSCEYQYQHEGILNITSEDADLSELAMYGYACGMTEIGGLHTCKLCRYHAPDRDICMPYSKFGTRKYCFENEPMSCSFFRPNKEKIKFWKNKFEEFRKSHSVDVWMKKDSEGVHI